MGFKESGFGFGFTRQSGERAWVIVWYGNGPVALGSLHLQVPVSAVALLSYDVMQIMQAQEGEGLHAAAIPSKIVSWGLGRYTPCMVTWTRD